MNRFRSQVLAVLILALLLLAFACARYYFQLWQ
jgi:hypothetical protein